MPKVTRRRRNARSARTPGNTFRLPVKSGPRSRRFAPGIEIFGRITSRDLLGIGTTPEFAIGQRALLIRTPDGNFLWDCIALLDQATIELLYSLGGIRGDRDLASALLHHHGRVEPGP